MVFRRRGSRKELITESPLREDIRKKWEKQVRRSCSKVSVKRLRKLSSRRLLQRDSYDDNSSYGDESTGYQETETEETSVTDSRGYDVVDSDSRTEITGNTDKTDDIQNAESGMGYTLISGITEDRTQKEMEMYSSEEEEEDEEDEEGDEDDENRDEQERDEMMENEDEEGFNEISNAIASLDESKVEPVPVNPNQNSTMCGMFSCFSCGGNSDYDAAVNDDVMEKQTQALQKRQLKQAQQMGVGFTEANTDKKGMSTKPPRVRSKQKQNMLKQRSNDSPMRMNQRSNDSPMRMNQRSNDSPMRMNQRSNDSPMRMKQLSNDSPKRRFHTSGSNEIDKYGSPEDHDDNDDDEVSTVATNVKKFVLDHDSIAIHRQKLNRGQEEDPYDNASTLASTTEVSNRPDTATTRETKETEATNDDGGYDEDEADDYDDYDDDQDDEDYDDDDDDDEDYEDDDDYDDEYDDDDDESFVDPPPKEIRRGRSRREKPVNMNEDDSTPTPTSSNRRRR